MWPFEKRSGSNMTPRQFDKYVGEFAKRADRGRSLPYKNPLPPATPEQIQQMVDLERKWKERDAAIAEREARERGTARWATMKGWFYVAVFAAGLVGIIPLYSVGVFFLALWIVALSNKLDI